ncbi:hypothetical protein SRABI02_03738 [Plantibacter cousiniae]|nr:hypothetical protein SRABI02_03738 [Plantibacter cousiniae]
MRAPWVAAIAFALVPVVFTAGASAAAQLSGASEAGAALVLAAGAAVSAILGLVVMRLSPSRVRDYGYRRPRRARVALWFIPAAATVLIILGTQGIRVDAPTVAAYGVLVVAVALNEETWFRGIVFAILRARSTRTAAIGSSVLFGVLHLANLAGGADVGSSILQVAFAALFGLVAAQLLVLTGSLWPAIAWHAAWNFVSFIGGDSTDSRSLVGLGAACVVMLGYAVFLGRRRSSRPDGSATTDAPALP